MDCFIQSVFAAALVGVIGRCSPQIWFILTGLLQPDLPNIKGSWKTCYNEKNENAHNVTANEVIRLKQLGRLVWGEGNVYGRENIIFEFNGKIVRNVIVGQFKKIKERVPSGSGAFQLIINGSNDKMKGYCIWLDKDTEKIDASKYSWEKC